MINYIIYIKNINVEKLLKRVLDEVVTLNFEFDMIDYPEPLSCKVFVQT